jgi:hypothetical protein
MSITEKLKRVINVWAKEPDFSMLDEPNPVVQKIIIGESPTNSSAVVTQVPPLPYFDTDFKNLAHLYLWTTAGLETLPSLAVGQQVLEVRKSADLTSIDTLPTTLHTLVLEDCPQLVNLPKLNGNAYASLVDLSFARCPGISADWINQLIASAPNLKRVDLSGCPQIINLPPTLPTMLDRLDLNNCVSLKSLPDPLPLTLRRLELSGATAIAELPDFPRDLDYLNLAKTESLTSLPAFPKAANVKDGSEDSTSLRTLFLYRSGILEPPASEHGATETTNVAGETREYFEDVELVGKGNVRRCKLLFLGNGGAGKTRLALNLNPNFVNREANQKGDYPGSTHGVHFWDWPKFVAERGPENSAQKGPPTKMVNLHMWDFGGQEIYHSTHRLFVSRGSVFVVLWNPDQDGKVPPEIEGYQDIWYPVRYWLDYIHMECPHTHPLIAIVCSHQGHRWQTGNVAANEKLKRELKAKLHQDIGDEYANRFPLFVLDSESDNGIGERSELETWLKQSTYKLVAAQGTAVPTYWEVAQNMVENWLPKPLPGQNTAEADNAAHAVHSRLTMPQFTANLHDAILHEIRTDDHGTNFELLRANFKDGDFLTERRIQRTLRFLTHSGWLYWKEDLHDSRVIIDQRWALNTAYATLQRRRGSVRDRLLAAQGRFTLQNLKDWCWKNEALDDDDQKLILSFMASAGVCFELSRPYSSGEKTFLSPTHLPEASEQIREFHSKHLDQTQIVAESRQLHQGHWFAILRELCSRYGDTAVYTKNACLIHGSSYRWNKEDKEWSALLQFCLDDEKRGLGGKISISVAGAVDQEKLPSLQQFVQSFLPGFDGKASDAVCNFDRDYHGCLPDAPTVFFSYAWDPVDKKEYYEEPVNAVFNALTPFGDKGAVKLLRDKYSMEPKDYITEFITHAGSQNVDLMIVFTSEKYWRSWWCMIELCSLLQSLQKSQRGVDTNVLVIEHESGRRWTAGDLAPIVNHWKNLKLTELDGEQVPKELPEQLLDQSWKRLVKRFLSAIELQSTPLTSDAPQIRKAWSKEKENEIIVWVKQKLGLPLGDKQ